MAEEGQHDLENTGGYEPIEDAELIAAIDKAFHRMQETTGGEQTIRTKALLIVEGRGWDTADGKPVDQFMVVPLGSHEEMLGLIAGADTRFRAEIIAAILERDRE